MQLCALVNADCGDEEDDGVAQRRASNLHQHPKLSLALFQASFYHWIKRDLAAGDVHIK